MLPFGEFLKTSNINIDGTTDTSSDETKKTEPASTTEQDFLSSRDFIRQQESSNNYDIGFHYKPDSISGKRLSSAYGPYGFVDNTYKSVQRLNPELRNKSIDQLSKEEHDLAFNTLWEDNTKYLKRKGLNATADNLRLAHFLGGPEAAKYLESGKFSDATIKNYGSEKEADIVAGAYMSGIPVKEYRKLYAEGKAPKKAYQEVSTASVEEPKTSNISWVDADTVIDEDTGTRVRLAGINNREAPSFDPKTGRFKQGDFGGQLQEEINQKIAKDLGYTELVYDPNKVDKYSRATGGDLLNDKGERFSDYLLSRGLATPTQYSDNQQLNAVAVGRLERAQRASEEPFDRLYRQAQGTYEYKDAGDYLYDVLTSQTSQVPLIAKPYATSARQYGAAPEMYAGPAVIRPGEDRMGFARSNLSTGLDSASLAMRGGYFGALEMATTLLNYDEGRKYAESKNLQVKNSLEELPFLKNAEAFDARTGEWKIDSFGKALDFITATAAQSAPDMLVSLIAFATAAPTFGASLLVPVARYSGEVWNNQEPNNKNAGWAISAGIASTALDRLGIGVVSKSINAKEILEEGIKAEMKKPGMTREIAEQKVIQETKKVANQVINAFKAGGTGALAEGVTESLQQTIQYFGGTQGELKDPIELTNQVVNAFVGGAALGGAMSGGGRTISLLTTSPTNTSLTSDLLFREKQLNEKGSVDNTLDVISEANSISVQDPDLSLNKTSLPEESKRETAGLGAVVKNWWNDKGIKSLFGKYSNTIIDDRGYRGKFMAAFATVLGANNAVNGGDIYSNQDTIAGVIRNSFGDPKAIQGLFKDLNTDQISKILSNPDVIGFMDTYVSNPSVADPKSLPTEIRQYADSLKQAADKINSALSRHNTLLGKTSEDTKQTIAKFFSEKFFNKGFIANNRETFLKDLQGTLNLNEKQAIAFYDMIMGKQAEMSFEDMLQTNIASASNLSAKIDTQDTQRLMEKYFHNNIFDNVFSFAQRSGVEYVNKNLIGKDGAIFASLINAAQQAGEINAQEASFMAKEAKDFLAIREGTYKKIDNPLYNGILGTITFFSTIASLPLATISSLPEAAQVMRGLSTKQTLRAYRTLLSNVSLEMFSLLKEIGTQKHNMGMASRMELSRYGFSTGEQNVADRYDIQTGVYQKWTNSFFKLIGLQGFTNATRYARLSIAGDAINNWVNTLINADFAKLTQPQQDAYEHLIRLGVDPTLMIAKPGMQPADAEYIERMYERAAYNFVNEAVVHPNPLNRPKFYSDPYLKMFTLFQGYISTFTANILPRLYGDLGRKGSADQRNAMATIASMIALTMLALAIKDMIKYGEHPPEWLKDDDEKLLQRLIGATGLTGTGERVINFVNPLIEKKANNPAEKLYNILEGESPVLSYTAKVGSAINSALDSDSENTIKKIAKVSPGIGSINQLADYLQDKLGAD